MTAFVVAEVEVTNAELADQYRVFAREAVAEFGGTYVVRPQAPVMLEGEWVAGRTLVVLGFESVERAQAWFASEAYAKALHFSRQSMIRRISLVEGAPIPVAGPADR